MTLEPPFNSTRRCCNHRSSDVVDTLPTRTVYKPTVNEHNVSCSLSHDSFSLTIICMPWIFRGCEPEFHCGLYQFGNRIDVHLLHHFSPVSFHRDFTYPEFQTNLFIQHSGYD